MPRIKTKNAIPGLELLSSILLFHLSYVVCFALEIIMHSFILVTIIQICFQIGLANLLIEFAVLHQCYFCFCFVLFCLFVCYLRKCLLVFFVHFDILITSGVCNIYCSALFLYFLHPSLSPMMSVQVYRMYKQYHQQVQAVITSFESVAGLSTAAPYAFMALKAMSKHFRRLRNMISNQLHHTNKNLGKEGLGSEENPSYGLINNGVCIQRMVNNSGTFSQPRVWRPQRGLPECAVAVLRAWLFEHFLHP